MKDLSPFIRELLFNNDCVILPGYGGFIGNYTPARIDRESHTFYPPIKSISFNSKLNHNDGLLIGKISEKKDMGYPDAKKLVEDYIKGLRNKLEKGERVHLDDIGHFQLNGEGSIQFEPDNNVNYLLDSYGLSAFTREPVEDYDISKAIIRNRDKDPIVIANRRRMVWRAAVAIPFVLALVIVPLKTDLLRSEAGLNPLAKVEFEEIQLAQEALFREMPETNRENTLRDVTDRGVPGDENIILKEQDSTRLTETEEKPLMKEQTTGTRGAGVYYLVVGSFEDDDNASRLLLEIATKGYNAELIKAANGYYRVCAESYGTIQEARNERSRVIDLFPGVWIWKK